MCALQITQAVKEQIDLRAAITGPTGSGKTYTSLRLAFTLAGKAGKVLVIDTERKSARKYAGESPDDFEWSYDVLELPDFGPSTYTEAIQLGIKGGYSVIIIDSLSHAWEGPGGILELQNKAGGRYQDWATVNPFHFQLIDTILTAPCHIITTMRSKMEYAMETNDKGKLIVTKQGLAPIQRKGVEYEFDFIIDMDWNNMAKVDKTRCSTMRGKQAICPGPGFFNPLVEWLGSGEPVYHFADIDRLYKVVFDEFGLDREEVKTLLKNHGYTGFKSQYSSEIYRLIAQAVEADMAEETPFDDEPESSK